MVFGPQFCLRVKFISLSEARSVFSPAICLCGNYWQNCTIIHLSVAVQTWLLSFVCACCWLSWGGWVRTLGPHVSTLYTSYSVKTVQHIFVRNVVKKNIVNYSKHLNLCTVWAEHGISIVSKPSVTRHVSVLQTELRWLWVKIPLMFGEPLLSLFCKGNRM